MRRTLITGGAGFIGSHLADLLISKGHEVWVLDDLSTGSLDNVAHLVNEPRFHLVVDSVLQETVVNELVLKVDEVYHLAAAVGVRLIVDRPAHTLTTNIRGTENVLDLCARFGRRLLVASTSEVYGDRREPVALAEGDHRVYGPTTVKRWAYAASKEIDEFLALAYREEQGLDVVIARLFNTVGPRQTGHYGMVLPRFVAAALAGETLQVHGDGEQSRCFCDVDDTVRALAGLMEHDDALGGVFNVGNPTEPIAIGDLARRVVSRLGSSSDVGYVEYAEVYGEGFEDMRHRRPSIDRIQAAIGWTPAISLDETIERVAAALSHRADVGLLA